ncbi:uncharacterized protein LOC116267682 isoform X2 [Nymphaea colorata]|uniref:uncharacterized protein LOC116267682 isoform X2 n=1 Tax=Nymphaea colorata TaxID=210225 RepID=UPI00129E2B5D|nr:uncharacterized protein LOC116267682 isoform X2 [Nymphaea colorata]
MAEETNFHISIETFVFFFVILFPGFHGFDSLEEFSLLVLENASRPTVDAVQRIMRNRDLRSSLVINYWFTINIRDDQQPQPSDDGGDPILAVTVITISSTILYSVVLNPSKMIGGFATAGRFRFSLYITFIVMMFVSLILGFFLLLFSGKLAGTDTRGPVWMKEDSLAQASVASLLLAMAVGLCAVLPKLGSIVVGVVGTLAACLGAAAAGLDFGASGDGPIAGPI